VTDDYFVREGGGWAKKNPDDFKRIISHVIARQKKSMHNLKVK